MINRAAELGPTTIDWWQDWRGQCAAIVGSGPSAKTSGVEKLEGRPIKIIVTNNSYKLAPWADILYSCDLAWWKHHKGAPEFRGRKVTHDRLACREFKDLIRIEIEQAASDELLLEKPTYLGAGGNSGFQAFNLAIQFGATKVALIGIDCSLDHGDHWHGRHPVPMNNPAPTNVKRWMKSFNEASGRIRGLGIEVVNCSQVSTITAYPKMSVDEVIKRWTL